MIEESATAVLVGVSFRRDDLTRIKYSTYIVWLTDHVVLINNTIKIGGNVQQIILGRWSILNQTPIPHSQVVLNQSISDRLTPI